jgi:intracellular multiplication protein IcmJ
MSLLPITLGVRRTPDAQGTGGKRKSLDRSQLKKHTQQALERDNFTCRYCGFYSRQYQKAIPKDWQGDPVSSELVTACTFCEQCLALDLAGQMGSGTLVWLPDISQLALNNIMRAVYASRAHGKDMPEKIRNTAQRAFDVILHARGEAKRRIGTDDPGILASVMLEGLNDAAYAKRSEKLQGLKLMPLDRRIGGESDQFPRMVTYWISKEGPFGDLAPEKWESMAKFAQAAKA